MSEALTQIAELGAAYQREGRSEAASTALSAAGVIQALEKQNELLQMLIVAVDGLCAAIERGGR